MHISAHFLLKRVTPACGRSRRARVPHAGAVRDLRSVRPSAVRRLPLRARSPARARVRALRLTWRMAGPALRRVLGTPTRLRQGPFCDRVRRSCAFVRARVEGTWPPKARRSRRGPGRRSCAAARVRSDSVRSGRSQAGTGAGRRPAPRLGPRARTALGAPGDRDPAAETHAPASARAYARRAAPERARDGGCSRNRTRFRRPGRRRLHVGCHRRRVRVRAQASGRAPGRGRDPGESGALDSSPKNSFQNDRPSRGAACRHGAHFE